MKYFLLLFISYLYLNANAHVFVYHRFNEFKHPSTNISSIKLIEQFEYLKKHSYKVVSLSDLLKKLNQKETIPDNWVLLMIDDGYKSFYTHAFKIFKEYKYPFVLALYVKAIDDNYKDFLTWKQIKEISNYSDISLHSYSHKHLTHLGSNEIYEDTKKGLDLIFKKLNQKVNTYVYPFGEYNQKVFKEINKFKFDAIFNQSPGSVYTNSDVLNIRRIPISSKTSLREVFKYKTIDVKWMEPLIYPKDGILKTVYAKVNPKLKNLKLFITGYGWSNIVANNGIIELKINKYLKKDRIRLSLATNIYTRSSIMLIKNKGE